MALANNQIRGLATGHGWKRFGAHGVLIAVPASILLWALIALPFVV